MYLLGGGAVLDIQFPASNAHSAVTPNQNKQSWVYMYIYMFLKEHTTASVTCHYLGLTEYVWKISRLEDLLRRGWVSFTKRP